MFRHATIARKCIKETLKANNKTKIFFLMKRIKRHFMENTGTFFYFIYVIYKNNCQANKTEKKIMLQSTNYEDCKYEFFYILTNCSHTSSMIGKMIEQ